VGVKCPGCANLVRQAYIVRIKLLRAVDDLIVGHAVIQGIIDSQQPFPGLGFVIVHSFFSFFATATSLA
jgi:hypothetical protein